MLPQLLCLVLLVGLTATMLLLCFEKWGWLQAWENGPRWLPKRSDLYASYWLCVLLLLPVVAAYLRIGQLGYTAQGKTDLSFLFNATPMYARYLLGIELPSWAGLFAAFPVALPSTAVCRVLFGLSTRR
jgi:hypothetical protein